MTLRTVKRGRIETADPAGLEALLGAHGRILIDVGTGDAMYPYREAKKDPDLLCIGIDPVARNMIKASIRIGRKPARGGVNNLLLIVAGVDNLPPVLEGRASRLTVLFPWGSLLTGLSAPVKHVLDKLRALMKTDGDFEVLLNMRVFEDKDYRGRQGLPALDSDYVESRLKPAWAGSGLQITFWEYLAPGTLPARTTWGQQLTLGSGRNTLHITALAGAPGEGGAP